MLGHLWSTTTNSFGFRLLEWPQERVKLTIPALLPPFEAVKSLWKEIWNGVADVGLIEIPGVCAAEWRITDIIEYVCSNPVLMALFVVSVDMLEVIIKADAFPVAGGHCFLLTVTFGNFGILCKCTALHFIAAVANCTDKDRTLIGQVLSTNFKIIDVLHSRGTMFIQALGREVNIRFVLGGDDKILRLIAGLAPSCSNWCCFYCYLMQKLHSSLPQCRIKRSVANALHMCKDGSGGHEAAPFLRSVAWTVYKMCVLHALLAMGRVFCHWLFNWLVHLETESGNDAVWIAAEVWLKSINVNVKIRIKPLRGSWSVKGISIYLFY